MNILITRRRGYSKEVRRIMTTRTNSLMLATCYNAGWVRNNKYMTKKEALAVTSIGTTFKNLSSGSDRTFREFKYFTGVTALPSLAFYNSTKLVAIELPNSITVIGSLAFSGSKIAGTLELPNSVTEILANAITISTITKLIVPSSVTTIANAAIQNINTIKYNSSLSPHYGNNSETGRISNESKYESDVYTVVNDMLLSGENDDTIFAYPLKKTISAEAIFVPGVTKVGAHSCRFCKTGSISKIPEGITTIGNEAFNLVTINDGIIILPNSLVDINNHLRNFYNSNIKAVYYPASPTYISGFITSTLNPKVIVFASTTPLTASSAYTLLTDAAKYGKWIIYVPDGCKANYPTGTTGGSMWKSSVAWGYADRNLRELPSWFDNSSYDSIEQGLNALRSRESRRMDCTYTKQNVTPTTLFSAITNIDEMMIDWKTVTLSAAYTFQSASGTCTISPILIDKTFIEDSMFQNVTAVTSVTLNSATTSIGKHSFDGCTALTTINLTNVTTIDDYAFKDCSAITTLNVAKVTTIGEHAFENCTGLTTLTLTAIETIGNSAFTGCTNLDLTTIDAIMAINEHAFD